MKSQRIRLHFPLGQGGSYKSVFPFTHMEKHYWLWKQQEKKIAHKMKLEEKRFFQEKKIQN